MPRIEIDDEVYQALADRAVGFQQPNDVLRGVLALTTPAETAGSRPVHPRPGRLSPLVAAGLVKKGDSLVHVQPRKGLTSTGEVLADGWIKTAHGEYAEPSPALRDLVGSQIDGWAFWKHQASGQTLKQLRQQISEEKRA